MHFFKICNIISFVWAFAQFKYVTFEKGEVMDNIVSDGAKLFLRTIIIGIMCFLVAFSILSFGVAAFSEVVGYKAYGTLQGEEESVELYTYYNEDGKDTKWELYESKGYEMSKGNIRKVSTGINIVVNLIAQVFGIAILAAFIYPKMWDKGNSDYNMVKFQHSNEDTMKGLKIGLVASVPGFLLFLLVLFTKNTLVKAIPIAFYQIAQSPCFPLLDLIAGDADKFGELSYTRLIFFIVPVLLVPLISMLGYYLGYKGFSFSEKFTYKKLGQRRY